MHAILGRLREGIDASTARADAAALDFHPPGKWSIAEILDHLSTTYAGTARALGKCLEEGNPKDARRTLKQCVATLLVIYGGYFPTGRQAPEFAKPRGIRGDAILKEIRDNLDAMDRQITACEERFGKSAKLFPHFIFGPLTASEWRKFHLVHGLHHLKQVRALREKMARGAAA